MLLMFQNSHSQPTVWMYVFIMVYLSTTSLPSSRPPSHPPSTDWWPPPPPNPPFSNPKWDWGDGAFVDDDAKKCTVRTGASRQRLQAKVPWVPGPGARVVEVSWRNGWLPGWGWLTQDGQKTSRMFLQFTKLK